MYIVIDLDLNIYISCNTKFHQAVFLLKVSVCVVIDVSLCSVCAFCVRKWYLFQLLWLDGHLVGGGAVHSVYHVLSL